MKNRGHQPDFPQLLKALTCQGEPDFVPLAEIYVDPGLKEAVLGRPIRDLAAEVDFWDTAGYDYILMHYPTMYLFRPDVEDLHKYNLRRLFAEPDPKPDETKGYVTSWEEFERFPWPDPARIDLSVLDEVRGCLPDGMKVISGTSGIFEQIWMLMGNVDLDKLLSRGTPEDVDEGVRLLIERPSPDGGYVLGSSNSITHYVPPDNYRAMLAARDKYGVRNQRTCQTATG